MEGKKAGEVSPPSREEEMRSWRNGRKRGVGKAESEKNTTEALGLSSALHVSHSTSPRQREGKAKGPENCKAVRDLRRSASSSPCTATLTKRGLGKDRGKAEGEGGESKKEEVGASSYTPSPAPKVRWRTQQGTSLCAHPSYIPERLV